MGEAEPGGSLGGGLNTLVRQLVSLTSETIPGKRAYFE